MSVIGTAVRASATIHFATGVPGDTKTITVGGKVYTWQTTLSNTDGNIYNSTTAPLAAQIFTDAVNLTGAPTARYAALMSQNTMIVASCVAAAASATVTVTAYEYGAGGDAIALTTTCTAGDFVTVSGSVLANGFGPAGGVVAKLRTWLLSLLANRQLNAQVESDITDIYNELTQ